MVPFLRSVGWLAIAALPLPALAASAEELRLPAGLPVGVDGRVVPGEWADAHVVPLGPLATVRWKRFADAWFLGVDLPQAWPPRGTLLVYVAPEGAADAEAEGVVSIEYEALDHDRPHAIVRRQEERGHVRIRDRVVAQSVHAGRASAEIVVPLDVLPPRAEPDQALRVLLAWSDGTSGARPTWPPEAGAGGIGAALASTARWARIVGAGGTAERPAFATEDWQALLARQQRLEELGRGAHEHVALLVEEMRISPKHDEETQRVVFDAFAEIARHEPLSPRDHLAGAQALRLLNRHDEALAVLDVLARGADVPVAAVAREQRAQTLEGAARFPEAAAAWQALAATPGLPSATAGRVASLARLVAERGAVAEREHARRAALEAKAGMPRLEIATTRGTFVVVLDREEAPDEVAFVLEHAGLQDGTLWHDVRGEGFARGGVPASRDAGPRFTLGDREGEPRGPLDAGGTALPFLPGAFVVEELAGNQIGVGWMVLTGARQDLAGRERRVVGHVVAGMDVVRRLAQGDRIERVRVLAP